MSEKPARESPEASQRPFLAVFDDKLRSIPLGEGTLLIGRSRRNHLRIHDHLLSRKHCSLTLASDKLTLVDLNSSNGTYVNGDRVGTRDLEIDDIIELGKTVMVVFDGSSWRRGDGLMNLRNPLKAQELVQRLQEEVGGIERSSRPVKTGPPDNGVRPRKGLSEQERGFLRWLERGDSPLLPGLVADYLTHKLVSLLVRNATPVRSAFTAVLEEMMRPEFFHRFGNTLELRATIAELVARELEDLHEEDIPNEERDLLEPAASIEEGGAGQETPSPEEEPAEEGSPS